MLRRLCIRDFVLVEQLELAFPDGFLAVTGETGAGKSLLVDALAFVCGERSDAGMLRQGGERAEVSAEFEGELPSALCAWLRDQALDEEDGRLLMRRLLDSNGRSRAWLNGRPATLGQLRAAAEWLVDIHGQHAHQSLLRPDGQRQLVDGYAAAIEVAEKVAEAWKGWSALQERLVQAETASADVMREREQRQWQVDELRALRFSLQEWVSMEQEQRRLANASGLLEASQRVLNLLGEGEVDAGRLIGTAISQLAVHAGLDDDIDGARTMLESASNEIGEAVHVLRRFSDRFEVDPERLAEIETRQAAVLSCARKYRTTPQDLPQCLEEAEQQLAELADAVDMAALQQRLAAAEQAYRQGAELLSSLRRRAADALASAVNDLLDQLSLGGGVFEVALLPLEAPARHGLESIELRFNAAGGEPRPLAKVASGGELSRLGLAIQVATGRMSDVPTRVFDEVDVGIGGGVAEVVGRLMRSLGESRQVMCVTHLPQVAAQAHSQWSVSKPGGRSEVAPLDAGERVEEIARMLGGVTLTETTRQHAREMLALT